MLQKLPANDLKWVEDICEFVDSFIKIYNEDSDERYFLEVDIQHPERLQIIHNNLPFLPERM